MAQGVKVWNDELYRMIKHTMGSDGYLNLTLSTIEAKYVFIFKELFEQGKIINHGGLKHISAGAIIKTADSKYIFGNKRKAGKKSEETCFVGGVLAKDDGEITSGTDIEHSLIRELDEEINVQPAQIEACEMIGLVQSNLHSVLMAYTVNLNISSDAVVRLHHERNDGELQSVLVVPEIELAPFMRRQGGLFVLSYALLQ